MWRLPLTLRGPRTARPGCWDRSAAIPRPQSLPLYHELCGLMWFQEPVIHDTSPDEDWIQSDSSKFASQAKKTSSRSDDDASL